MNQVLLEDLSKDELLLQNLELKAQNSILTAKTRLLTDENALQAARLLEIQFQLQQLQRLIFGRKSETHISTLNQSQQGLFDFALEPLVDTAQPQVITIEKTITSGKPSSKPNHPGRHPLPAHLPRTIITIEPSESTDGLVKIGEDITESLEYQAAKLYVNRYVRSKYASKEGGVLVGQLPARPIDKCIAGASLLAQMVVDKYADHMPLYRQMEQLKREGVMLVASTVSEWISKTMGLLLPLYEHIETKILTSGYVQADETPIKVLDKDKPGSTHRGYYWVYHAPSLGLVLFDYQKGRDRAGPETILKEYQGFLQTDGYVVYDEFTNRKGITVLGCMAHARRYFEQAKDHHKRLATEALDQFGALYAIERQLKEANASEQEIFTTRQSESLPLLDKLKSWMIEAAKEVLPKSPMGKAIQYSLERWDKLCGYTKDGSLHIDNNKVENSIRPVALGRKNYLFAGSHEAAQRAAMIYTLLSCCKMAKVNPYHWLTNVLERISTTPVNQIQKLLPQNWKIELDNMG
jgi:transposase